jgi:hypothetical protein
MRVSKSIIKIFKILKDMKMVMRLPPSCNRQDVRLYHNRILPPFYSKVVGGAEQTKILQKTQKQVSDE